MYRQILYFDPMVYKHRLILIDLSCIFMEGKVLPLVKILHQKEGALVYAIYNLKCRTKLGSWSNVVCERIISFYRFGRIAGYICLSWIFILFILDIYKDMLLWRNTKKNLDTIYHKKRYHKN